MAGVEIREVTDEAGTRLSLDTWNAVYWTMPASMAGQRDYVAYCLDTFDVLAYLDGEPVGSGFIGLEPDAASPAIARAQIAALPAARRRGTGSALYRHLSAWAAERGRTELEAWVVDVDPDGLAFATQRGFVQVTRESLVALDLTVSPTPGVDPPDGVSIVTWAERPELARGMYEVMQEAAPDIPGNEDAMPSYDTWLEHHMGGSSDRPEATFVALAGDEVVGYAKFHLSDARPRVALHDLTGVKRAWRGRGIARALKATQIAWAKREGYELLETANELRNAPIRRLNAEFGYEPIPGRALVRGPIDPEARLVA